MSDDVISKLFAKIDSIAIDVATIKAQLASTEKLDHESRLRSLENRVSQYTGGKALLLYIITTGIALWAAIK